MTFVTLDLGQPVPSDGEFEIVHAGKHYAVVRHPRNDGWMAMAPPKDWREAGMKAFTKRPAAVRWVTQRLPTLPPCPVPLPK